MKLKFLLLILAVLIVLPFFVFGQGEQAITDELGIMGVHKTEAENIIKSLEDAEEIKIRVYISKDNFDDEQSFRNFSRSKYRDYELDLKGTPLYNILIFYAHVYEGNLKKPYLGYVYSERCGAMNDMVKELRVGYLSQEQELSGDELLGIVKEVSDGIKRIVFTHSYDCIINICEYEIRYNEADCEEFDPSRPEDVYTCIRWNNEIGCYYAKGIDEELKSQVSREEDMEILEDKTVYLIDDNNWKDILSLYPLTTYHYVSKDIVKITEIEEMKARKNSIRYSPTLLYHREGDNLDLDSTLIFLKQFRPSEVVIVHNDIPKKLNLALEKYELKHLSVEDYHELWNKKGYEYIVVSENDYKTGLLASVFASYLNAPLVFENSKEFDEYDFEDKKVYYVHPHSKNSETYSSILEKTSADNITSYDIPTLQKIYVEYTNTDKIILVNPNDIKDEYCEHFEYKTEFGKIKDNYCRDSLVSPLLATLKNELIVFTDVEPLEKGVEIGRESKRFGNCTSYVMDRYSNPEKQEFENEIETKSATVKQDIQEAIENTCCPYVEINYLTIISSPKMIPLSGFWSCFYNLGEFRSSLDLKYSPESANGWIFGISISDTSSYMNRDASFYKHGLSYLPSQSDVRMFQKIGLIAYDLPDEQKYVPDLANQLDVQGYNVSCFVGNESIAINNCKEGRARGSFLGENDIILYDDHGRTYSWKGIDSDEIPELHSPIAIAAACFTMDYYKSERDELFGSNFIRMGGLGYYGGVSFMIASDMGKELIYNIFEGYDLGNTLKAARRKIQDAGDRYILLGDPTIKPALIGEVKIAEMKEEAERKGYKCIAVAGRKKCYRTDFFKIKCGEDDFGDPEIKCIDLSKKYSIKREFGGDYYVVFGKNRFQKSDERSITCGDFYYEGPFLATPDGDAWLGEVTCKVEENMCLDEPKIVNIGGTLKKKLVT